MRRPILNLTGKKAVILCLLRPGIWSCSPQLHIFLLRTNDFVKKIILFKWENIANGDQNNTILSGQKKLFSLLTQYYMSHQLPIANLSYYHKTGT